MAIVLKWLDARPLYITLPIAFATALAIGTAISTFTIWAARHGANAGSLITFLGSIVGIGLTMAATLYLDRQRRMRDRRENRDALLEMLTDLRRYLRALGNYTVPEDEAQAKRALQARASHLKDAVSAVVLTVEAFPPGTVRRLEVMRAIVWLQSGTRQPISTIESIETNLLDDLPVPAALQDFIATAITSVEQPINALLNAVSKRSTL